jgi:ubiquitin-protein ligase
MCDDAGLFIKMSLPKFAQRRILSDIREFKESGIKDVEIYHDESSIDTVYVAIVGTSDTVYEDGMYFYKFVFPSSYPFEPPTGTFLNWQNASVRIHPNMYVNGKLCLSILGTWSGPSWTSAMTLTTIIITIQSIMTDNPLVNEPSFDLTNKTPTRIQRPAQLYTDFANVVRYCNYRDYIYKTIHSEDNEYHPLYVQHFSKFIKEYYTPDKYHHIQQSYVRMIDTLTSSYLNEENGCVKIPSYYGCSIVFRPSDVKSLFL